MITTGIVKRIDDLGRIHIPKELRKEIFGTEYTSGKQIEFFYEKDGAIIIKPYKEDLYH